MEASARNSLFLKDIWFQLIIRRSKRTVLTCGGLEGRRGACLLARSGPLTFGDGLPPFPQPPNTVRVATLGHRFL